MQEPIGAEQEQREGLPLSGTISLPLGGGKFFEFVGKLMGEVEEYHGPNKLHTKSRWTRLSVYKTQGLPESAPYVAVVTHIAFNGEHPPVYFHRACGTVHELTLLMGQTYLAKRLYEILKISGAPELVESLN